MAAFELHFGRAAHFEARVYLAARDLSPRAAGLSRRPFYRTSSSTLLLLCLNRILRSQLRDPQEKDPKADARHLIYLELSIGSGVYRGFPVMDNGRCLRAELRTQRRSDLHATAGPIPIGCAPHPHYESDFAFKPEHTLFIDPPSCNIRSLKSRMDHSSRLVIR